MTGIAITGWSVTSAAGVGVPGLREALDARSPAETAAALTRDATGLSADPLPATGAPVLADFDVRAELGRKGTSLYDRSTALAVVTCGNALLDAGVTVDDETRGRIGVVLGTTVGSLRSINDFNRTILTKDKPYQVNPARFPNTVMNAAAAQVAIRYGLRGVNATIAGGQLAFPQALRYAATTLRRGYVDTVLVGAVEEFSAERAWQRPVPGGDGAGNGTGPNGVEPTDGGPTGEGAAVFTLRRASEVAGTPTATVLGVATGYGGGGDSAAALAGCVRRLLGRCQLSGGEIGAVVTGESGAADTSQYDPACDALSAAPERIAVTERLGDCGAATGALALAVLFALPGGEPARRPALLTTVTRDGAAAAALVAPGDASGAGDTASGGGDAVPGAGDAVPGAGDVAPGGG